MSSARECHFFESSPLGKKDDSAADCRGQQQAAGYPNAQLIGFPIAQHEHQGNHVGHIVIWFFTQMVHIQYNYIQYVVSTSSDCAKAAILTVNLLIVFTNSCNNNMFCCFPLMEQSIG